MDELLKEVGKGFISLANMLLVMMFFNHIFLGNLKLDIGLVSLMIYIFTTLYLGGAFLIKIGRKKERNDD
jgi:hypothetical protein